MPENQWMQRIERLEQSNRKWRLAALVLLLCCLVVLVAGFDFAQPNLVKARIVEAQNFVLRDSDGQIRARMAIGDDGPSLSFFDEHGNVTASLPLKAEVRPAR